MLLYIVLNPLGSRIPERLFVKPINHLLTLFRDKSTGFKEAEPPDMPVELAEIRSKIISLLEDVEERTREAALVQIATQVAHDIRSPLMVLKLETDRLTDLPEFNRSQIKAAIERTNDIANNLLTKYKQSRQLEVEPVTREMLSLIVESALSEKRVEKPQIHFDLSITPDARLAFTDVSRIALKRVLSNLFNNAVESIPTTRAGRVCLSLTQENDRLNLTIRDNGCGMPDEVLKSVFARGFSYDKSSGSGLGLYDAAQKIHALDGKIYLSSAVDVGSTVDITLPLKAPPPWFSSSVALLPDQKVIILDDEPYLHKVLDERFARLNQSGFNIQVSHYYQAASVISQFYHQPAFYLLDYELKEQELTGLDVVSQLGIADRALLVTNCFDDATLRERCVEMGLKLFPKILLDSLQIVEKP
jgi:signal transduction histidine kinase